MKTFSITILISLLLPFLAVAQEDPVAITLPVSGFVETTEASNLAVAGTIEKGFWENPISRHGGTITVYASAGGNQVSHLLEKVEPTLNPRGKVIGYTFNVSLEVEALRGEVVLPLKISIEARNRNGELEDYDEVWGTIEPNPLSLLEVTLSPNTPEAAFMPKGGVGYNFTEVIFTAQEDIRINQITLTRIGGIDSDLLNIRLFDANNGVQLGSPVSFVEGRAEIGNVSLTLLAGMSKTLVIKTDISVDANSYSKENGIAIGIADSVDIKAISMDTGENIEPSNFEPVFGNIMGITDCPNDVCG